LDQAKQVWGGLSDKAVFQVACYHHRPSQTAFDEHLLTKADWIASGHDRRITDDISEQVAGLQPILATLEWPNPPDAIPDQHVPTGSLSLDTESFLPIGAQEFKDYGARCRALVDDLVRGLQNQFRDPSDCVERLSALLERVFHAVPASRDRRQQPDVNLFDHSRMVAAFAACLAVQHETGPCDAKQIAGRYRLLGVDLGGIQSFIMRPVLPVDAGPGETGEKGMARRLRGRSFFVSLLSWLAARRLLDATGLPHVNLLVHAGGRALLLFPESEPILTRIQTAVDGIEQWFAQRLGSAIRLDLAVTDALDDAHFTREKFAATFRELDHRLAKSRLRGPAGLLRDQNGWLKAGWVDERSGLSSDQESLDAQSVEWGQRLPRARFLSLDSNDLGICSPLENVLGYTVGLHESPPNTGRCFALRVDAGDDLTVPLFLMANHVPRVDEANRARLAKLAVEGGTEVGDALTFEQIAHLRAR
jgi:CRISPR-associated protein Cas10/Csm1 subtype III-A